MTSRQREATDLMIFIPGLGTDVETSLFNLCTVNTEKKNVGRIFRSTLIFFNHFNLFYKNNDYFVSNIICKHLTSESGVELLMKVNAIVYNTIFI